MDLEELLRAARDGQPGAWDALRQPLIRELRWVLSRWFRGERREELVRNAMVVVIAQLPGFQPEKSLAAWVRGIARNVGKEALRRRSREAEVLRELLHLPESSKTSVHSQLDRGQVIGLMNEEIAALPGKLRRALEHERAGGDDEELAAGEGVSVGTIRTRRHRAWARVRHGVEAQLAAVRRRAEARQLPNVLRPVVDESSTSPSPT